MEDRFIRVAQVVALTGRSKSSLYRDEKLGLFPRRKKIGKYAIGWKMSEIRTWLDTRPDAN